MFLRSSLAIRKDAGAVVSAFEPSGAGMATFGATASRRTRTDEELLRIDTEGPPGARLALDALSGPEGAAEWNVWGPAAGSSRAEALDVKRGILKEADPFQRTALIKQAEADGRVEIKKGHPWSSMISRGTMGVGPAWLWMAGDQMMELFRRHTQTLGEHAAVINRTPVKVGGKVLRIPTQLLPVVPTWFEIPNAEHPHSFKMRTAEQDEVNEFDMLWYKKLRMSNPYGRGVGVMQCLSDDLELDEAQVLYLNAVMKSVGQTRQALVFPFSKDSPAAEGARLELEKTRGPERASRMSLMFAGSEEGVKSIKHLKLGETPADLEAQEARGLNRDTFLRTNQVPPGAVGVSLDVNRANAFVHKESLRTTQRYNLESMRKYHQARFFEPLGNRPAEYAGEDRFFCMWHLAPLRDNETARIVMGRAPEMFNQEQFWEVSGFEGGDPNKWGSPGSAPRAPEPEASEDDKE